MPKHLLVISTVHPKNTTIIQNHTKGFVRQRGARHLNNIGADPKEQFNSGLNTFTTFFPSPLTAMRLTGSRFNVATFGSTFKGTFLTKLKAGTRGLVIKLTNKATDLIHGKTLLKTIKSIGETIIGN